MSPRTFRRWGTPLLTIVLAMPAGLFAGMARAQSPQRAGGTSASAAATQPTDGGWPRLYQLTNGGRALIYQPQVASWDERRHLVAWSAVSYETPGAAKPALGTVKIEADTRVAHDDRLVNFSPFQLTESNFPTLSREAARAFADDLQRAIPEGERVIALDRVLVAVDKSQLVVRAAAGVKADPPKIFESTAPAVLVNFDGEPVWSPVKDLDLKFAVNTNWDIFEHTPSKTLYLRDDAAWLKAASLEGPWTPAGKLPASFTKLPADNNWKDVRSNLPGRALSANAAPRVFTSNEPAELILLKGPPRYTTVAGTSLLWVSNTESDLFRAGQGGPFYYLVAGRWFSAPTLDGPWSFATTSLPEDFKRIPVEHPRSRVLASVPGTDQAAEAVLLAQVPQTARVNRKELKAPGVTYQGEPEFKSIESTSLARAVNTDKDILRVGDLYYMCFQGVWFTSRSAKGPWEVTASVPKEIYEIPASSPAHHVTYVTVEKDDDDHDDWVTFAAVAGYTGMMIAWGCAVWGTGWWYPPYVWYGGFYPAYFWYPPTYGLAAWYNPYTGTFGRGAAVYGPYGGAGGWAAYNPGTGTYARGGAVYGPYGGSRGFAQAWNPRTGTYAATRQGGNVYGNWGSSYVQRGDHWAQTGHVTNYAAGRRTTAARGSEGGAAVHTLGPAGSSTFARTGGGDIYAGHDGNVYRKQDGSWQKWNDGGWSPAENPQRGGANGNGGAAGRRLGEGGSGTRSTTLDQLDRDHSARTDGAQRLRDNQTYRSGGLGGRDRAGSFHGGGLRRGGFRRR